MKNIRVEPGDGGTVVQVRPSQAVVLNPSLALAWAYYRMDTSALHLDSVGNATLGNAGATLSSSGIINGAAQFDSGTDIGGTGFSPPAGGDGFTVRFWLKVNSIDNSNDPASIFTNRVAFLSRGAFAPAGCFFAVQKTGASTYLPVVTFLTIGSTAAVSHSAIAATMGQWVHLVAIYDRAALSCSLYVNGVLAVTASLGAITGSGLATSIFWGPDQGGWAGLEDECGIWAFKWAANDVVLDYNNGAGQSPA